MQTLVSLLRKFLRGIQICHMRADVLAIPKMWCFLGYNFLNPSYCYSKSGQISGIFSGKVAVSKKKTRLHILFRASILNQRGRNRYVLRLIQWQNLKRKIVAVSWIPLKIFCIGVIGKNAKK